MEEVSERPSLMLTVALYSCMWCTLYFTFCLINYKRSYEWNVRLVTAIHAVVVTLFSLWCAFIQGPWPFTDTVGKTTPLQQTTVCICLGYFLFDLSWCIYYQTEGPAMISHHLISILGFTVCLVTGWYGTELIACIIGSEVSNPFLQIRWFLKETGRYDTILGEIVDLIFMFLFGGIRIGVGSYLLYCYFQQDTDIFGRFGGVLFYALSWLFMINILAFAYKKYTRKFRKWQSRRKEHLHVKDKSEGVPVEDNDNNHNVRYRKVKNGLVTSKNIQNTLQEIGTEEVIGFSVNHADIITS